MTTIELETARRSRSRPAGGAEPCPVCGRLGQVRRYRDGDMAVFHRVMVGPFGCDVEEYCFIPRGSAAASGGAVKRS